MHVPSIVKRLALGGYRRHKLLEWVYQRVHRPRPLKHYPTELNVELTTICNARCTFCTREKLMRSGARKPGHMDEALARHVLDRLLALTRHQGVGDSDVQFTPVGLGEPLHYPALFDVIAYARELWPAGEIRINTNGIALDERRARLLADSPVHTATFSLCFIDPGDHREKLGVDAHERICENIERFLRLRSDGRPAVTIHVFDLPENRARYSAFAKRWLPHFGRHDLLALPRYVPMTTRAHNGGPTCPCGQLWTTVMVDIEGYVYPCCAGVWIARDPDLCLGHIDEPFEVLLAKLEGIRQAQLRGEYGTCANCAYLYSFVTENRRTARRVRRGST